MAADQVPSRLACRVYSGIAVNIGRVRQTARCRRALDDYVTRFVDDNQVVSVGPKPVSAFDVKDTLPQITRSIKVDFEISPVADGNFRMIVHLGVTVPYCVTLGAPVRVRALFL